MDNKIIVTAFCSALLGAFIGRGFGPRASTSVDGVSDNSTYQRLSVRNLRLVDDKGQKRAQLSFTEDGAPALLFFDNRNQKRMVVSLRNDEKPQILMYDTAGVMRTQFGFSAEDSPALYFSDSKNRIRLIEGLYGDGQPSLVLNDEHDLAAGIFRLAGANSPVLVFKSDGRDRAIYGLQMGSPAKDPFLVTTDSKGVSKNVVGTP
jgi:hypothetical protein